MSNAWVTGASGFLGRHTARALSRRGFRVAAIGLGPWDEPSEAWGIENWLEAPVERRGIDRLAAEAGSPDAVIHLAGGSSVGASLAAPLEDFERSVPATATLLDWIRRHAPTARLVFASSAAVYGSGHRRPISAATPTAPFSPYGFHKRMSELLCESYSRAYGVTSTIVRLFSVYGPGLRKQLLWDLCGKLAASTKRVELSGTGKEVRDWIDVNAAAHLLADAINEGEPFAIRNGGTGCGVDVATVAELVMSRWGSTAEVVFSGESRAGDPEYLVADMPGSVPGLELAQGVEEYVNWYRRACT